MAEAVYMVPYMIHWTLWYKWSWCNFKHLRGPWRPSGVQVGKDWEAERYISL